MYKIDDIGSTYLSLPPNLQDVNNQCYCYALDRQMEKFKKLAYSLTIWSDLDNVDPKYYDFMAMCIRSTYYRSEYTDEQKLNLIKTAIMSYRYAGTKKAVDQLLNIIFSEARFISWDEYKGIPYHFRVQASDVLTEDSTALFNNLLKKVKAARSIMDALQAAREYGDYMYVGGCLKTEAKSAAIKEEGINVKV